MQDFRVRDWMTTNPVTCTSDTSLPEAHKLMTKRNVRRLPVLDRGKLVGIVTLGDVRGAEPSGATSLSIFELHYLLARLPVSDIMCKSVITIGPEATIAEAARLMLENKIAGLPVMENGQLVGILTESDIFRLVAQSWQAHGEQGGA